MSNLFQFFKDLPSNLQGWRTNRKIVVFESDDWGSIRMPSREVYEKALAAGYRVDLNEYEKYDSLLSQSDLEQLFVVLGSFNDKNGRHPIITANCVVANPDFKKIREGNFSEYSFESILDTFKKYPNHKDSFELWKYGLKNDFLQFQYHAREHLNVSLFMNALNNQDPDVLWGFDHGMPGMIKKGGVKRFPNPYVEATRFSDPVDMRHKMDIYFQGLGLFDQLFGFKSKTVIPTNYLWNSAYDKKLIDQGVIGVQGIKKLINPLVGGDQKLRFTGLRKDLKIIDLVRNVDFELSQSPDKYALYKKSIDQIKQAFMLKKPAIISIHRINFSGEIFIENRDENLKFLYELFLIISKKWPDVEYLSSDQLSLEILGNDSYS